MSSKEISENSQLDEEISENSQSDEEISQEILKDEVKIKRVKNPKTGRMIATNSKTYKKLVKEGEIDPVEDHKILQKTSGKKPRYKISKKEEMPPKSEPIDIKFPATKKKQARWDQELEDLIAKELGITFSESESDESDSE